MAADVSRQQIKDESKCGLVTRDFLGLGGCYEKEKQIESKELDLDFHVPSGWEKRLDLKSGKVYLQRCNSPSAPSDQRNSTNLMPHNFFGLNSNLQQSLPAFKSSTLKPTLNLLEDTSLDLKLVSNCSPSSYTSVCTLDKVKSALDRAERASPSLSTTTSSSSSSKKRFMGAPPMVRSPSESSSSSSMSFKDVEDNDDDRWSSDQSGGLMVATACPGCLLYVLISKNDPKCPKCNSLVQLPMVTKKPKIDLNMSI